jgi:hypothetical protein
MTADRRVLLLEFVTNERWVYDSRLFPYIKGCADGLGCATRWLCYGTGIRTRKVAYSKVEQFVQLEPDDLASLDHHLGEIRPTHAVISHPLPASTLHMLGASGARILTTSDHPGGADVSSIADWVRAGGRQAGDTSPASAGGQLSWHEGRTDWLLRWLGESEPASTDFGKFLVGAVRPSYDAVMANEKATRYRPHLLILGGLTCDHFAKVAQNEHFAGIDLSDCPHDHGCSYCTWYRGASSDLHADPVALAEEQLRRVIETTRPGGRSCGVFDLLDIRLFRQIARFVDMVVRLDLPPSIFCFEPRIDRVLQVARELDGALAKLASRGHSVYLFRMGAENLVEEENEIFNKEISLAEIDEGSRQLEELAAAHPSAFGYDPTWGYITCSPWTTLEMLELGLQRAAERGFEPLGVWLYTPLLLYRNSPITKLAQREGLLRDEFEDLSLLYEPSVNNVSFDTLTPWRFKDERTGVAFALIARFCAAALRGKYPDTVFEGDALYARLLSREPGPGLFTRPDLFAREVVAVVKASTPPFAVESILDGALDRYQRTILVVAPHEPPRSEVGSRKANAAPSACDALPDAASVRRAERLTALLRLLLARFRGVSKAQARPTEDQTVVALHLQLGGTGYELRLGDPASGRPCLFRTRHFNVWYMNETPLRLEAHIRVVRTLMEALDAVICRQAPELLPRGVEEQAGR